jgi:hypothetical protein
MKKLITILTAAVLPLMAHAEWFNFSAITANDTNGTSQTVGETQFWVEIVETSPGNISALFTNIGPYDSRISEIYFDTLDPYVTPPVDLQIQNIIGSDGVAFTEDANPSNPPGGGDPLIAFYSDESADSKSKFGIDPYESLLLELTLSDPPYDFLTMLLSGDLRIAVHAQSLGENGQYSESFINNIVPYDAPTDPIPEPGTLALVGIGALGLIGLKRKLSI